MKKLTFVFSLVLCYCLISNSLAAKATTNKGSHIELQLAWQHSSFKQYSAEETYKIPGVNMWKGSALYKHQAPKQLYVRAKASVAASSGKYKNVASDQEEETKSHKYRPIDLSFELGLGFTFAIGNNAMISPFVAAVYNNWTMKKYEKVVTETTTPGQGEDPPQTTYTTKTTTPWKTRIYGLSAKGGIDFQYLFENNFTIGLLAAVGLIIDNHAKVSPKDGTEKIKLKNTLFWEVSMPISYIYEEWKVGLEIFYTQMMFKSPGGNFAFIKEKMSRVDYGISAFAGFIF